MPSHLKKDERRALSYLRKALAHDTKCPANDMQAYARISMLVDGYAPIVAEQAVARAWRDHFETQPPI